MRTPGAIKIRGLSLRYRKGLPLALRKVGCDINAGEKVGICGRTGAGKSSLIGALFRLADEQTGAYQRWAVRLRHDNRNVRACAACVCAAAAVLPQTVQVCSFVRI